MSRVKRGFKARRRRKEFLLLQKGTEALVIAVSEQLFTWFVVHYVSRTVIAESKNVISVACGSSGSMQQLDLVV